MTFKKREISKEQFEAVKAGQMSVYSFFYDWERFGYGIYSPHVIELDGKYFVSYYMGDSCD